MSDTTCFEFWFNKWSEIDYDHHTMDELPWEVLVAEYGEDNIKHAIEKGWLSMYNTSGGIITDCPPDFEEYDMATYIDLAVNGETMAQASKMLIGKEEYEDMLQEVNDQYGYPYDDNDSDTEDEIENRCTECNVDMGPSNPRQLCGKTYCHGHGDKTPEEGYRTPSPKRKRDDLECPPAPKKSRNETEIIDLTKV